jgi:hypothetical protein
VRERLWTPLIARTAVWKTMSIGQPVCTSEKTVSGRTGVSRLLMNLSPASGAYVIVGRSAKRAVPPTV